MLSQNIKKPITLLCVTKVLKVYLYGNQYRHLFCWIYLGSDCDVFVSLQAVKPHSRHFFGGL